MSGRAFERAGRGALVMACVIAGGCTIGRITIVSPSNGGFTDPRGAVTARVSISGGTCGNSFEATLDGVDITQRFSPQPPASQSPQAQLSVVPGEHLLRVRVRAGSSCTTVFDKATFAHAGAGAIYVSDGSLPGSRGDRIIRMADMTGSGWTAMGSTGAFNFQFSSPRGLYVHAVEKIFVADQMNRRIVLLEGLGTGAGFTAFGTQGAGAGQFLEPFGVSLDGGMRIHVSDVTRNRVVRIDDLSGGGWTELGGTGNGVGQFVAPAGVVVGPGGKIYVVDSGNHRIVRMDAMTGAGWTTFGSQGSGPGQFLGASWLALDASGRLYVVDTGNCRIARVDGMTGANWVTFGAQGAGTGQFDCQTRQMGGIFVDTAGRILVADSGNARIVRFDDMTGLGWVALGTPGTGIGQFVIPNGVFVKPPALVVAP
jgi:DNA-binding beta-propeller fold protein YncE